MTSTVAELITNAYFLSGKVARDFETPSGGEISDGLRWLNAIIAFKTANNRLIPYYSIYESVTEIGEPVYFIPNLISVQTFTFNLGNVRFSTFNASRKSFFGTSRVDGIQNLPFECHFERCVGGSNLFLYFSPNDEYPIKIVGKFALASVTMNEDLEDVMDAFYRDYLLYALAQRICQENGISFPPECIQQLKAYEQLITDISPRDLTVGKISTLTSERGIDWAYVNFPGWTPS
jgi:hypothetical protein